MSEQEKATSVVSPKGTAFGYVGVTKPDTKFKPEGEFKIRVKFKADEPGVAEMIGSLQDIADKELAKAEARAKKDPKFKASLKGKPPKAADTPFYQDEDGDYVVTFKSKASYVSKKPGTEGETITRVIPIWGPKGRYKAEEVPKFGEGSVVKISFTPAPFFTAAVGAGVSLRLEAVKILVVKAFEGGGSNPFGDEEGPDDADIPPESFGDGEADPNDEF